MHRRTTLTLVKAAEPSPPVTPLALEQALEQSHEVKAKVESCADDLALANEGAKQTIAAGVTTLPARETLDHNEVVETKVQECAEDLESVTKTLAQGIDELKLVEAALASSKVALAEANLSLDSALAGEEQANLRALHDHMTGLPNRALFDDRVAHALALAQRHQWSVAVMFIDLDRFKDVNDTHGHAAGDVVLKEIAKRLAQDARDEDAVCRNGGDEFLYLLINPQGRGNVERVAAAVIENLARTIRVGEQQLSVRPSIGIAIYPDAGVDGSALIQNADAAMYRAKKSDCGFAVHESRAAHDGALLNAAD
jgi:diguanylate cyclase (GGDEF)-like protein